MTSIPLLLALDCNGSSTPPALMGDFAITDAIFTTQDVHGFAFSGTSTIFALTDFPAACDKEEQAQGVPTSKTFAVAIASVDASGSATPAVSIGRYAIIGSGGHAASGLYAQALFHRTDATCTPDVELEVTAGDVAITRLDSSALEGDLHFTAMENTVTTPQTPDPQATGDHLTTHFVATVCPALSFNITRSCP
jgi:hypothetical protein